MTSIAEHEQQAPTVPPEPTVKHYWPVMQVKGLFIGKCAQVLPNHCRCWRDGDYLIEDHLPTGKAYYQLCRTHVTLQKLADKTAKQQIEAGSFIQVPAAYELPIAPTTLEALQRLESMAEDPNAVYPPPLILTEEQLKNPQFATGGSVPLAESLTQPTDPKKQVPNPQDAKSDKPREQQVKAEGPKK